MELTIKRSNRIGMGCHTKIFTWIMLLQLCLHNCNCPASRLFRPQLGLFCENICSLFIRTLYLFPENVGRCSNRWSRFASCGAEPSRGRGQVGLRHWPQDEGGAQVGHGQEGVGRQVQVCRETQVGHQHFEGGENHAQKSGTVKISNTIWILD